MPSYAIHAFWIVIKKIYKISITTNIIQSNVPIVKLRMIIFKYPNCSPFRIKFFLLTSCFWHTRNHLPMAEANVCRYMFWDNVEIAEFWYAKHLGDCYQKILQIWISQETNKKATRVPLLYARGGGCEKEEMVQKVVVPVQRRQKTLLPSACCLSIGWFEF